MPCYSTAPQVTLCFAQSVASTRFMIQDEMRLETTPCDNCIIGTMIFLQVMGVWGPKWVRRYIEAWGQLGFRG